MDKFWNFVEKTEHCWNWTGCKSFDGYGNLTRTVDGKRRSLKSHRYIYEQTVGEIPEGLIVRHKCDNPSCVNPEHLILGTKQDNSNDCVERNRQAKSTRHGKVKLTENDAIFIKSSLALGTHATKIARCFNVSRGCIRMIQEGRSWNYV